MALVIATVKTPDGKRHRFAKQRTNFGRWAHSQPNQTEFDIEIFREYGAPLRIQICKLNNTDNRFVRDILGDARNYDTDGRKPYFRCD